MKQINYFVEEGSGGIELERKNNMSSKKTFDKDQAQQIGEQLGIKWNKFEVEEFRRGMDVELEHGLEDLNTNVTDNNSLVTGKIALAHLNEFPDYYTRLDKMEEEAEEYWEKKNKN
jgi:hypothetical protein